MNHQNETNVLYTLGIWVIKPGREKEFIEEWTSFAKWTDKNFQGIGKGYLLQDEKEPLRFISFGPWKNENIIHQWRESKEFKEFTGKIIPLCENFHPNTLRVVATSS